MSGRPCDSEHATNRFPQKVAALRLANRSHRMALCTGSHSPTVAVRRHPKRREPESRFTPLARGLLLRAVAVIRMIKRMHPGRLGRQRVAIRLITLYPPISAHARTRRLTIPHPAPASVLHSARPPLPGRAPRTKPPGIRPGWHRGCLCTSGANQPRSCSADAHRHTRRRLSRTLSRRASHNEFLLTRRSERRYF